MKYENMRAGYRNLWNQARIRPERLAATRAIAERLAGMRAIYATVASEIGCPWYLIAAIHQLESGASFRAHLHNGDPLTARTTHVPAGRPAAGSPPFTWQQSALDALRLKGLDKVGSWELERVLFEAERYNGWGYIGRVNSPYIWSFTTIYDRGKFIADHVWSATAVSQQCGVAAILKALEMIDALEIREPIPVDPTLYDPLPVPTPAKRTFWQWLKGLFT